MHGVMSQVEIIETVLSQAARWQRWQRAWQGAWHGCFVAALLWLVALLLYKLLPLPFLVLNWAALAGAGLAIGGFVAGGWRKTSLLEAARWVDRQERLQERLSTALEVAQGPGAPGWRELVLADAAQHAGQLDARRLLPFHLPKICHGLLVVLAVGAGLGFVPEYRSKEFRQKQREVQVMREVGQRLSDLARRQLLGAAPALAATREHLEALEQLGNQLNKVRLSRAEALHDLANVADKLKQEARQLSQDTALKRLEQAARQSAAGKTANAAGLQKQIEELQKSLAKQASNPEALKELSKELQKAQETAAGMAGREPASNAAAKEQLGKTLGALSQRARDLGLDVPGLTEAIEALAADKTALLVRDLDAAAKDLEKLKEMEQALQQLQQQAERLGKDLAEQLKNGQAQAAESTLRKMIEQLKDAQLPPAMEKKILDEVAQAISPAADFGKVADHLKQAANQMRQGDRPGAAQSLANAADELGKILDEMGDMDSIKAALEALQKAQLAVASGQAGRFGQSKLARGGRGQTKGGRGFGTWAQEEGWLQYPEYSELWENPPDNRGTLDPRSPQDKDGTLADNLDSTKIRGQLAPGNSMPSIPLKGVSIKGQSTVSYQESAMAPQSDAQHALSQDQIPRAYQGAVKDYFDDQKP
jgi:hypothetical protein